MNNMTKKVLDRVDDLFKESYIPTTFHEIERNEEKAEILCTLHSDMGYRDDEIMGEFFFIELADGSFVFNTVMTLSEELNSEFIIPLSIAISRINPYLEMGCLATDVTDTRLLYKLSIPISAGLKEDDVYDQVDLCIGNALSICEKYIGILLDVNEGDASIDEAVALAYDITKLNDQAQE